MSVLPQAVGATVARLEERVWRALRSVRDPEIPVLDVVEMGIVRDVVVSSADPPNVELGGAEPDGAQTRGADTREGGSRATLTVTITPTFSACPALHEIRRSVHEAARAAVDDAGDGAGYDVDVVTTLYPPWSSDDMTPAARDKLERFGIAPAQPHGGLLELALEAPVRCPRCGHPDTRVRNTFGSTLCREIRSCKACDETFERFKPL